MIEKEDVGFEQWPDRPLTPQELSVTTDSLGLGIDPDILPLIIDLNEAGYQTSASCSGDSPNHPFKDQRHGRKAWVDFKGLTFGMLTEETLEELDSIIKDHTRVPYKFSSLGGDQGSKNQARVFKAVRKSHKDIGYTDEYKSEEELEAHLASIVNNNPVMLEFRGPIA